MLVLANEELHDAGPKPFETRPKENMGCANARLKIYEVRTGHLSELNCGSLFNCLIRNCGLYQEGRLIKDRKGRWYATVMTAARVKNKEAFPTIHCYCINREKAKGN